MIYLAVLGRQPEISIAELNALLPNATITSFFVGKKEQPNSLAKISLENDFPFNISRLGGTIKLAEKLEERPLDYLKKLPDGKLTIGVSDYSKNASKKTATLEALKLKKILVRHNRSVRIVENKDAILSTASSLHNGLSGKNERKVEFIKLDDEWYKVIGIQDIDAYAKRDQARPARDAKVGMLPPKLAQILINLCGPLESGSRILDPFCGTGVVLQEALLMGYTAYGTDLSDKMIDYSERNLNWLIRDHTRPTGSGTSEALPVTTGQRERVENQLIKISNKDGRAPKNDLFELSAGDATSFKWSEPIAAVACESYLGRPMSTPPVEIKLKDEKQTCSTIILGFLKNLSGQIKPSTPAVIAIPAWLRPNGSYSRLEILDEIEKLGYNVNNQTREGLLYHREGQIVARDIIILRKN